MQTLSRCLRDCLWALALARLDGKNEGSGNLYHVAFNSLCCMQAEHLVRSTVHVARFIGLCEVILEGIQYICIVDKVCAFTAV